MERVSKIVIVLYIGFMIGCGVGSLKVNYDLAIQRQKDARLKQVLVQMSNQYGWDIEIK